MATKSKGQKNRTAGKAGSGPEARSPAKSEAKSGGLWRALRGVLALGGKPPKTESARPKGSEDDHWVDITLADLLKSKPDDTIYMISMTDYRIAIGAAWERLADRIIMIAESTIRQSIGPANRCFSEGETFLLVFPRLGPAESRLWTEEAAKAVGSKLVGEKFGGSPGGSAGARIRMGEAKANTLLTTDGAFDHGALAAMVARARPVAGPEEKAPREQVAPPRGRMVRDETEHPMHEGHMVEDARDLPTGREVRLVVDEHENRRREARLVVEEYQAPKREVRLVEEEPRPQGSPDPRWRKMGPEVAGGEGTPHWQEAEHRRSDRGPQMVPLGHKPKKKKTSDPVWAPIEKKPR